jgi:hypothetical protein
MTRATDGENRRRAKKRTINWVAGLSTLAALLSGSAGMIAAANGVWHPPVPIPVLKATIAWVGPGPTSAPPVAASPPAAIAAQASAEPVVPLPSRSSLAASVPTLPVGPSTVADLGKGVTMWIRSLQPSTTITFTIANHGVDPFVLDFEPTDVTVYDDQTPSHVYGVWSNFGVPSISGNHQVIPPSTTPCEGCINFSVDGSPSSLARHWTVALKAISGRTNVSMIYTLG